MARVSHSCRRCGRYDIYNQDTCYWTRLSGFGASDEEVISEDSDTTPTVTILPGDVGFRCLLCGTWTKIG